MCSPKFLLFFLYIPIRNGIVFLFEITFSIGRSLKFGLSILINWFFSIRFKFLFDLLFILLCFCFWLITVCGRVVQLICLLEFVWTIQTVELFQSDREVNIKLMLLHHI